MATHHVIIGGGPAATNAAETIRQFDPDALITLISDEPAHSRMALPYWLAGNIPREHTYTGDDAYFQKLGVQTRFGARVDAIDAAQKTLSLGDGDPVAYDKLLIATGSSPAGLPIPGSDLPGVQTMWTLSDTEKLLADTQNLEKPRVVLIGAGFIGFIVLNAMFKRGWTLNVVEQAEQVLPRMLDSDAASIIQSWLDERSVGVHTSAKATQITENDGVKSVHLDNGTQLEADIVIVATGIRPNTQLADGAGIQTDQAILVDERMRTSVEDIYAAGDVAQGSHLYSDTKQVLAIQTTAVDQGRIAGANMTGQEIAYEGGLLMNVVDVCGLQASSFGAWDTNSPDSATICNISGRVYRKLVMEGERLVGAIFVGRPDDMGMLTDVGMVKGILQTQTPLGPWADFLRENPFDVRRAYVGAGVAAKLAKTTLLGRPAQPRSYQFSGAGPSKPAKSPAHSIYVDAKTSE